MKTLGEGDLQKGSTNSPLFDGSFDVLDALVIDILSQYLKKPNTMWTQMGAKKKRDDNGDDRNDHGEEWIKNPPIYNNVLS